MITSLNEWKKHLEKKGLIKEGKLSEEFDGEMEDADFLPAGSEEAEEFNTGGEEEEEEVEEGLTFEQFKDAILAEYEKTCVSTETETDVETEENEEGEETTETETDVETEENEEGEETTEIETETETETTCEMLDEQQLLIAYNVCLSFCSDDVETEETEEGENEETEEENSDDDDDDFEFESIELPTEEEINEIFGKKKDKGKSAYKNTAKFVEGDSEEAKKVKEHYDKYLKGKEDSEIKKDSKLLKIMQHITQLGAKWAKENKMEPKDYSFKQIRTVLEGDYDRVFTGGTDVTVGESKETEETTEKEVVAESEEKEETTEKVDESKKSKKTKK